MQRMFRGEPPHLRRRHGSGDDERACGRGGEFRRGRRVRFRRLRLSDDGPSREAVGTDAGRPGDGGAVSRPRADGEVRQQLEADGVPTESREAARRVAGKLQVDGAV